MKRQLTLFDLQIFESSQPVYDPSWDETETTTKTVLEHTQEPRNPDSDVLEQATTDTKSAPEHNHWIEKYPVTRYQKQHYYYRYLWMDGRKLHHVHIPGGNVRSPHAQNRKQMVENAIADGQPPSEIEKLIHSWRGQ